MRPIPTCEIMHRANFSWECTAGLTSILSPVRQQMFKPNIEAVIPSIPIDTPFDS